MRLTLKCDMISNEWNRTNEDKAETDTEGQDVASQGFIVLSVAFGKHLQTGIDVVLT